METDMSVKTAWAPPQVFADCGVQVNNSQLYNGMIAPLLDVSIRGAVWYQGESDEADGPEHAAHAVHAPDVERIVPVKPVLEADRVVADDARRDSDDNRHRS